MSNIPIQEFIDSYHRWLRKSISYKLINNYIEITTPFLDRDNDHMNIYIYRDEDGKLFMTDAGYILNNLEMSGVSLNSPRRQEILTSKLNGLGVKLDNDNLEIAFTKDTFPQAKNRLIQAMLSVDDMFYLSSPNVKSLFLEEVQSYFLENHIYAVENVNFTGISGMTHNYDYVVQRTRQKPERLVKVFNTLSAQNAKTLLFSWQDTAEIRKPDSALYTIYNDTQRPSDEALRALDNYGVKRIPWSNRNQLPELLSVS